MHAPIRVLPFAFDDDRFARLAVLCGLADNDHARGKVERLWDVCTRTQHYTVSQLVVQSILGPRGVEGLLGAELAELVPVHLPTPHAGPCGLRPTVSLNDDLLVRIRGTKGRIEAHGQRIRAASEGGKERAKRAADGDGPRDGGGKYTSRPAGRADGGPAGVTAGRPAGRTDAEESTESVENLSATCSSGVPDGNQGIHSDEPPGWSYGNPGDQPGHQPSDARASDPRSLRDQIPEGRHPARGANLRVVGGADREGSGS